MSDPLSGALPVGSVLPYVGTDPIGLESQGWLLCDGRYLMRTGHAELFEAIGTANGAPNAETFNLPDLRGYFLRGVSDGTSRDPNATTRTAAAIGGNTGDAAGSVQQFASASPDNAFTAQVPHLPGDRHRAYYGTTVKISESNSGSVAVTTTGGGDHETRPKNKYVYFIIKAQSRDGAGQPVEVPVAAIAAFAGVQTDEIQNRYLPCDGRSINNSGTYADLFEAIRVSQGGDGDPNFNIPDYRGYFLRGVAEGRLTDPDRDRRTAPFPGRPDGQRGNAGDQVGSVQADATALPQAPFRTTVAKLPTSEYKSDTVAGRSSTYWNAGSVLIDVSSGGGDAETRPINVSVTWYIRF